MKNNTQDLIQLAIKKGLLNKERLQQMSEKETLNADMDRFLNQIVKSGLLSEDIIKELVEELAIQEKPSRESTPTLSMSADVKRSGSKVISTVKQDTLFTAAKEMDARDQNPISASHPAPLK